MSYSEKSLDRKFSTLFSIISNRCVIAEEPTIVCLAQVNKVNTIRAAKNTMPDFKIYNWFYEKLFLLSESHLSLYLINLNDVFSVVGYENVYDDRNWYFAHCRLSTLGVSELSKSVSLVLKRHYYAPCKVLVLDCDNTIWGGVIGEDGVEGIVLGQDGLGQAFVDF